MIAQKNADKKDVTKVDKIIKCALLVLLDYQNNGTTGISPAQFKADVLTKYDS